MNRYATTSHAENKELVKAHGYEKRELKRQSSTTLYFGGCGLLAPPLERLTHAFLLIKIEHSNKRCARNCLCIRRDTIRQVGDD
jgi:hypothetical protein